MKKSMRKVTVESVKEAAIEVKVEVESKELRLNKITKENFLGMADKMVLPKDISPYAVMALNYDCNSKVGPWTNLAMAICTSIPEEFFNEDGTPNKDRLMKAFKVMSLNGTVEHYDSVFKARINVAEFFLKLRNADLDDRNKIFIQKVAHQHLYAKSAGVYMIRCNPFPDFRHQFFFVFLKYFWRHHIADRPIVYIRKKCIHHCHTFSIILHF